MGQDAAGRVPDAPVVPAGGVFRVRAFAWFWSAATTRAFGGALSGVAFPVLIVSLLHATPLQISVLNALSVAPYLVLGLIAGALMDRWRRQRTLMLTSVGRALVLASIPVLLLIGGLQLWSVAVVILLDGALTLLVASAEQPLLPRLVPQRSLVVANARLGQSATVAGTAGPAIGGGLITAFGPSLLLAVDAILNAVAAVLQSRIHVDEATPSPRPSGGRLGAQVVEGLRYTYAHRMLRPLALSVHLWFLGNSVASTVFALFVLREVRLPPWAFGVALAVGGVGGLLGALVAPSAGARLGAGRAILLGRVLAVAPWPLLALVPLDGRRGAVLALLVASLAQGVFGFAMGVEDANDTGYRQSVAPDAIQGRMNSTIRTVNRTVFFFGALLTGLLATVLGLRVILGVSAIAFAAAAIVVVVTPLRTARFGDTG